MYDRETVIRALEYLISEDCTENQFDYADEIETAIALLRAQEAKPVKVTKNAYNHKFYYCPNCDRGFEDTYYKRPLFCDKCGQKVKWDDI